MTHTLTIPLTTLPVGSLAFGPSAVADNEKSIVLTIDRTVTGGLNSLTSATAVAITVEQSSDGGITWVLAVGSTFPGGLISAGRAGGTLTANTANVDLTAGTSRLVRASVTVTGTPVAVAGTLVTT